MLFLVVSSTRHLLKLFRILAKIPLIVVEQSGLHQVTQGSRATLTLEDPRTPLWSIIFNPEFFEAALEVGVLVLVNTSTDLFMPLTSI